MGAKCTAQELIRDACCHLENMIEYIDNSKAMSPFVKLLWPFLVSCIVTLISTENLRYDTIGEFNVN